MLVHVYLYMFVPANLDVYVHSDREIVCGYSSCALERLSYETENAIFCLMKTHKELTEIVDGLSIENS